MKKRKTYEVSVIDKTYSRIISDETKFYTSDTALELSFELKETEYNFESAEIVLFNTDDRSLVTRPVAKVLDSFAYELEDDITAHYGEWRGQLRFEAGETYVSSPVKFRIENDLGNERPPQLSDVQSWVSLKRYADDLVDDLKQAVLSVEGMEDTFNENELERQTIFETAEQSRQTTFETNEIERDETFSTNETTRQTQELEREKAEAIRQQAENQRQSTFEVNESERQNTFETAEQERQSAELIRVENENQRNLTSVDEFIKLQDSIGGRNLIPNFYSTKWVNQNDLNISNNGYTFSLEKNVNRSNYIEIPVEKDTDYTFSIKGVNGRWYIYKNGQTNLVILASEPIEIINGESVSTFNSKDADFVTIALNTWSQRVNTVRIWSNLKLERGDTATDWTPAIEDYEVVSKEDYYNHIKIMSEHRDNQLAELKTAITALGGA